MINFKKQTYIESHEFLIIEYEHSETGLSITFLKNKDPHLSCSISYRTPCEDNSGKSHMLEHILLRSSQKYGHDAYYKFMSDDSYTFVNASTLWDKTMYMASSKKYDKLLNIFDFYLDITLSPFFQQINCKSNIFNEECWDVKENDERLNISGRAYNEMVEKSQSVQYFIEKNTYKNIFEGSIYENSPGGEPHEMLSVSLESCIKYYKKHYIPSNCFIFIYGDVNIKDYLQLLERHIFGMRNNKSKFKNIVNSKNIKRDITTFGLPENNKYSYININWLLDIGGNNFSILTFYVLAEISEKLKFLSLDHLKKIGFKVYDINFIFDCTTIQPTYEIIVKMSESEDVDFNDFRNAIYSAIESSVEKIDSMSIKNIIENFENKYWEKINNVSYSKGLIYTNECIIDKMEYNNVADVFMSFKYLKQISYNDIIVAVNQLLSIKDTTLILFRS